LALGKAGPDRADQRSVVLGSEPCPGPLERLELARHDPVIGIVNRLAQLMADELGLLLDPRPKFGVRRSQRVRAPRLEPSVHDEANTHPTTRLTGLIPPDPSCRTRAPARPSA